MLPLRLKFSTKGLEPKKGADLKPLLGVGDTLIASRTWATMRPRCIKWSNSSGVSSVVNAGAPNFWEAATFEPSVMYFYMAIDAEEGGTEKIRVCFADEAVEEAPQQDETEAGKVG